MTTITTTTMLAHVAGAPHIHVEIIPQLMALVASTLFAWLVYRAAERNQGRK